jgi:preprotein translocase subunit SecD
VATGPGTQAAAAGASTRRSTATTRRPREGAPGWTPTPKAHIVSCATEEQGYQKFLLGPAEITGDQLQSANAQLSQTSAGVPGEWGRPARPERRGDQAVRRDHHGGLADAAAVAIVLDGAVFSAPTMNEPITDGNAQISGSFTKKTANDLANVLKFGALPLSFETLSKDNISPSLGKESLRAGLIAGLVGLAAVLIYIIAYYRGLGLVALVGSASSPRSTTHWC